MLTRRSLLGRAIAAACVAIAARLPDLCGVPRKILPFDEQGQYDAIMRDVFASDGNVEFITWSWSEYQKRNAELGRSCAEIVSKEFA